MSCGDKIGEGDTEEETSNYKIIPYAMKYSIGNMVNNTEITLYADR